MKRFLIITVVAIAFPVVGSTDVVQAGNGCGHGGGYVYSAPSYGYRAGGGYAYRPRSYGYGYNPGISVSFGSGYRGVGNYRTFGGYGGHHYASYGRWGSGPGSAYTHHGHH